MQRSLLLTLWGALLFLSLPFTEPPRQKGLELLYPGFRDRLERWLKQARATFPQFNIRVSETRRTLRRQQWLYGSGRPWFVPYGRPGVELTYTLDSRHRWGLAADLVITRKTTPWRAEWDGRVWRAVYDKVPPSEYGLRTLDWEFVHLEAADADALIAQRHKLGLQHT